MLPQSFGELNISPTVKFYYLGYKISIIKFRACYIPRYIPVLRGKFIPQPYVKPTIFKLYIGKNNRLVCHISSYTLL